eukprot:TRINITY_DN5224_c0_g2_i1.p1 TRINITY_DN5224_c0_g2~~TRINITY_DN5224_c0_g2_i1.p1  ORF type:complete len:316 (-),score=117.68 TRINITY_DN5224_c0_g2_i1:270-1217(-)
MMMLAKRRRWLLHPVTVMLSQRRAVKRVADAAQVRLPPVTRQRADDEMYLTKFLSRAKVASRREAMRLIAAGRVTVDGVVADTNWPVGSAHRVALDGRELRWPSADDAHLFMYYKPVGEVVSRQDARDRPTVFESIAAHHGDKMPSGIDAAQLRSVGRLDLFSEGLLLLTDTGSIAHYLEHPDSRVLRTYRLCLHGDVDVLRRKSVRRRFETGWEIDGFQYRPIRMTVDDEPDDTNADWCWVECVLSEGKNRELRRVFAHLGFKVIKLIRVSYGPYSLSAADKPGSLVQVPITQEIADGAKQRELRNVAMAKEKS